jgi:acyl-coenzyme A thioesterase PaaI-like protein
MDKFRDVEPSPRRAALFRAAGAIRDVLHRMVQSSAPIDVIEAAADELEAAAERFAPYGTKSMYEGYAESANAGEPFAFFDHSPMLGQANPLAPPIRLWLDGDRIRGSAIFGPAYEGPPGCVHGGYIAAAFDEMLGSTQSLSGSPGMTGRLTVHYRKPTPLQVELAFVGWIERVEGRKIFTLGELRAGEVLCAEAEGLFISIDSARFAGMKAERDRIHADGPPS